MLFSVSTRFSYRAMNRICSGNSFAKGGESPTRRRPATRRDLEDPVVHRVQPELTLNDRARFIGHGVPGSDVLFELAPAGPVQRFEPSAIRHHHRWRRIRSALLDRQTEALLEFLLDASFHPTFRSRTLDGPFPPRLPLSERTRPVARSTANFPTRTCA